MLASFVKRIPQIKKILSQRDELQRQNNDLLEKNILLTSQKDELLAKLQGGVCINDYVYSPKKRMSLSASCIYDIISTSVDKEIDRYSLMFKKMSSYKELFHEIPVNSDSAHSSLPCWNNGWLPPFDAMSIYYFLAERNPRLYVECGSGNTTKFAAKSIQDNNLRTKIVSIDPMPRAEIDDMCDNLYRIPFEEMDLDFFKSLTSEDMFVVDNSHRSFQNSDVTVFFTEVLPTLPRGILYGIHDICLPSDYPESWVDRYYNEQYLLATYLIGGAMGDKIVLPCAYVSTLKELIFPLEEIWGQGTVLQDSQKHGCFFWIEKA
ncbi:hypothetical protein DSECCO2_432810 [anaerobic digester metagenome]